MPEKENKHEVDRRAWLKLVSSAGAGAAFAACARPGVASPASPLATPSAERRQRQAVQAAAAARWPQPAEWTGRNTRLKEYYLAPGYPHYEAHPRYIGELSGTWHQMGRQYGDRAGDLIRMVYEGWLLELLPIQGTTENLVAYLREQRGYYHRLVPEALELMEGIADGARAELSRSEFPDVMSDADKILMINSYFGLMGRPPVSERASLAPAEENVHCCSGTVILGGATADGKTIHCSSEDQHFFPQEYLVTFIARPSDKRAHAYTVTDSAGEIGSEHAMNDHGVTVSGYAGGGMNILAPTLARPFSGYRRPGLDWQVGDFYATAFAASAEEAVTLLTAGRPEYRARSGLKIVIGKCARGANWVISDRNSAYVVESIPSDQNGVARYAIRRPGDMGEKNASYICSTNNVEANYSFNEDNVRDNSHPMSQHGNAAQDPAFFGLNGMGTRYWTFMWLNRKHLGRITPQMVMAWRKTHYIYDAAGTRHDEVAVEGRAVPVYLERRIGTLCRHSSGAPGVDSFKGINIYVSLSVPADLASYRTKGRPCEWVGDWDRLSLSHPPATRA